MSRYRSQHPAPRTHIQYKPTSPLPDHQRALSMIDSSSSSSEKQEAMTAIQEALICTTCKIDPPKPTPGVDLKSKKESSAAAGAEGVSLPPTTTKKNSSYEHLITASQMELYENLVDQIVSQDPETNEKSARYRVDYHIFIHYKSCRGALSLCRDRKDVDELKCWSKAMADEGEAKDWMYHMAKSNAIEMMSGTDPDSDKAAMPLSGNWKKQLPILCLPRESPWPNDVKLVVKHQEDLWDQRESGRQKRVEKSRARWKSIMQERARQRRLIIEKQNRQKELRTAQRTKITKVKFYWGKGTILREVALDSPL